MNIKFLLRILLSVCLSILSGYVANVFCKYYQADEYTRGYVIGCITASFYFGTLWLPIQWKQLHSKSFNK